MDTSKLYVGMVVKNYKELCSLLGEKVKSGSSKKYQLIDWERFFSWNKDGYKFIIEEIYEEHKDKKENRGGSRNVLPFIDEMELLLIDMLLKSKHDAFIISKSKLMLELCMVNPNYHKYFGDREKLAQLIDVNIEFVIDFYDTTSQTFKGAIDTVNKKLRSKGLVAHESIHMIVKNEEDINTIDSNDYKSITNEINRQATEEEVREMLRIERSLLKYKYNCNSVHDLFKKGRNYLFGFYKDLSRELEEELGILKCYKAEKYIYNVDELIEQKYYILKQNQIDELEYNLNLKVMTRIHDNTVKRYEKAINELIEYGTIKPDKEFRTNDNIVEDTDIVISTTIDKNNYDSLNYNADDSRIVDDIM